jgi:N-methylhydantoinase A
LCRDLFGEVSERITAEGRVIVKLNSDEVENVIAGFRNSGVESLAVCLINSYENPAHEVRIKEIVNKCAPDLFLSTSYEPAPDP